MAEKQPIDPEDVASSTAVGSAQRYGVGAHRRRREPEGAAVGVARSGGRRRRSWLSYVLTALVVALLLAGMLVAMVRLG
jgi:hypothetical protein